MGPDRPGSPPPCSSPALVGQVQQLPAAHDGIDHASKAETRPPATSQGLTPGFVPWEAALSAAL